MVKMSMLRTRRAFGVLWRLKGHLPRSVAVGALCYGLMVDAAMLRSTHELQQLRQHIKQAQSGLHKNQDNHTQLITQLKQVEAQIAQSNLRLQQLSAQQQQLNAEIQHIEQAKRILEQESVMQRQSLQQLLRSRYRAGDYEVLRLLLNHRQPAVLRRDMYYYRHIVQSRQQHLANIREQHQTLRQLTIDKQSRQRRLTELWQQQQQQREQLQQEQRQKQRLLDTLAVVMRQQHQQLLRLQQNERRLSALLDRLQRVANSRRAPSHTNVAHTKLKNRVDTQAFARLKGRLNLPVRGMLRQENSQPAHHHAWRKGIFIETSHEQPVKAVANGSVVFADWLRGFGHTLIVDHGGGYLTLYSMAKALLKQVGDQVAGGETVATSGSGSDEDYGVYFEIRYLGKALDPLPWMATF